MLEPRGRAQNDFIHNLCNPWNDQQLAVCAKYGVTGLPAPAEMKVGISRTVRVGLSPLNAVRYKPAGDTTGWYVWAGAYSEDPNFFEPLHVQHLAEWCPALIPFLQLPPGWGVVLAEGYEDAWYDAARAVE